MNGSAASLTGQTLLEAALAIVPGRCSVCVWSPALDDRGNSIAGIAALDAFTTLTGWSVF